MTPNAENALESILSLSSLQSLSLRFPPAMQSVNLLKSSSNLEPLELKLVHSTIVSNRK